MAEIKGEGKEPFVGRYQITSAVSLGIRRFLNTFCPDTAHGQQLWRQRLTAAYLLLMILVLSGYVVAFTADRSLMIWVAASALVVHAGLLLALRRGLDRCAVGAMGTLAMFAAFAVVTIVKGGVTPGLLAWYVVMPQLGTALVGPRFALGLSVVMVVQLSPVIASGGFVPADQGSLALSPAVDAASAVVALLLTGFTAWAHGLARSRTEHELEGYVDRLQEAMFERARAEAELDDGRRLHLVGSLAAGITHAINAPAQYVAHNTEFARSAVTDLLGLVNGVTALLERGGEDLKADEMVRLRERSQEVDVELLRKELLASLTESSVGMERITSVVGAMKFFADPGEADRRVVDLHDCIRKAVIVSRSEWKDVSDLELKLAPTVMDVDCRPQKVGTAVMNLILLAAARIRHGNGANGRGWIRISTRVTDEHAEIHVVDNGGAGPEETGGGTLGQILTEHTGGSLGQGLLASYAAVVLERGATMTVETNENGESVRVLRFCLEDGDSRCNGGEGRETDRQREAA